MALIEWEQSVTDETRDSEPAGLRPGGGPPTRRRRALWGDAGGVVAPNAGGGRQWNARCTCDTMGAPRAVKDAVAVIIIILLVSGLKRDTTQLSAASTFKDDSSSKQAYNYSRLSVPDLVLTCSHTHTHTHLHLCPFLVISMTNNFPPKGSI